MDKKLKPGGWSVVIGQNGATIAVVSHSSYGANHEIAHYEGAKSFAIHPEHKGCTSIRRSQRPKTGTVGIVGDGVYIGARLDRAG